MRLKTAANSDDTNSRVPGRARISVWLLVATLCGAALAVGTVHTNTLCVVTLALAISAVLAWWGADPVMMRPPATLLLVTGLVLTGYTALQSVPIPIGFLRIIAPHNADVWSRALAPIQESGPAWAPISIDPLATRVEVLKGVAYLLAFVTALRISRRRRGIAFLSTALVLTGILLSVAALLHPAFGARKLYGFWQPSYDYDRHLAPFLNPNNLASYINISFCLALALLLAPEPRFPRPILGTVVVMLVATQFWVASRGGVAALVLGAILVAAISRGGQMKGRQWLAMGSLAVGVGIAAGTMMMVLGGSEEASTELLDTNTSKLALFAETMRMLPAYGLFGTGRGAFETAFPAFRQSSGYLTFVYPENLIAQWLLEWGAPIGGLGLIAMVYGLRPNSVLARSASAAGAWAAIVAVAAQNLLDLGSEIPGLALATVVCGAIVVGGSAGKKPQWRVERWSTAPSAVASGLGIATILAIASASMAIGKSVSDDRATLQHALENHVSREQMQSLERESMLRHPGEPFLPYAGAVRAAQAKDQDPLPWIGATFERAAVYGPAHLLLARVLGPRSPSQTRMEYRLAMEQMPDLVGVSMGEAPRWVSGFDEAMELVPAGPLRPLVLGALAPRIAARLPATNVRLDREHTRLAPTDPDPAMREASNAVDDVEHGGAPWCEGDARKACVDAALAATAHAEQIVPNRCEPYNLRARAEVAMGDVTKGLRDLSEAADTVTERVQCLEGLASLAERVHDSARVTEALGRIAKAGCSEDTECAASLGWIAGVEEQRGNPQRARVLYEQALERAPEQDGLLESVARLAAAGGLHAQAADDYDRLMRRHPEDLRWKKAADTEREAAIRDAMRL